MAIKQAVDEVKIAWSATSRAGSELAGQMRLATSGESRDLLVPNMDPLDLALAAKRVRQPVETVADNAINSLNTSCGEDFRKLIGHRVHGVLGSSTTSTVLSARTPDGLLFARCTASAL
jgi:hypothetical protein